MSCLSNSIYIVPVYNKENLILDVLAGIENSHSSENPTIICVLDGCTDSSEEKVLDFKGSRDSVHVLYENDVHEITCLNTALNYIKDEINPHEDDVIFNVQDDVILQEENIDLKLDSLFNDIPGLGYVAMRIGTNVFSQNNTLCEFNLLESEFGAWNQLGWAVHESIPHMTFRPVEVAVRSPACAQWKRFQEVGFFDQNLAPAGYDCHDFSIRMNIAGYTNGLYIMKYFSDVYLGTMRGQTPWSDRIDGIYERNRRYLAEKHRDYFMRKM